MKKRIGYILALVVFIVCSLGALTRLLVPKYMGNVIEGAFIKEYYEDASDHDVIFLGDCEVYENISPVRLWEEYGITSYIRGSANQLTAQSYYLLEDTLKHEKPKAVVFNVLAMSLPEQNNEAYNRMTMEGMKWSGAKVQAIKATMMEEEHFADYIFPLLRYHSRWQELKSEDFTYYFRREQVSHNGYYMRADVRPVGDFPRERPLADYAFSEKNYEYLDRMRKLCEKEGIQFILMKAPSLYPAWHEEWEQQIADYASANDLLYMNCLNDIQNIGLDFQEDTYDGGLHLNLYGAEKLSVYLGKILKEACGLLDRREEKDTAALWDEKISFYEEMEKQQKKELEEYGYIRRFQAE